MNKVCNKKFICFSLLSLCFFILFVKLSMWQFKRAQEKQQTLTYLSLNEQPEFKITLDDITKSPEYKKIKLQGKWDTNKTILITNKYHNHQIGYHVITPFTLADQNITILINRGWTAHQEKIPSLSHQHTTVTGILKKTNNNQYIMGQNVIGFSNTKIIMQKLDLEAPELKQLINGHPLAPSYVLLVAPEQHELVTDWQLINVPPHKHLAYAIQWVLLAITVVLLYSYLCYKTYKNNN